MRKHRFGDERSAQFDEPGSGVGRDLRGLVGMRGRVGRPALSGYLVGVYEGAFWQQGSEREFDEGRFAGSVGPDDQVEPVHRAPEFTSCVVRAVRWPSTRS